MEPTQSESRTPWRPLLTIAKVVLGASLLGYLFWTAQQSESFDKLLSQPKHWGMLAMALGLTVAAVLTSFVRWLFITRAAGIQISLSEAIRVGALGYALNFVGPGAVSGDLFKAAIVARGRPGQRATVFTTILVDRLMGLFTMLLTASGAILATGAAHNALTADVRIACQTTLVFAGIGVVAVGLLFIPGVAGQRLTELAGRAPLVGGVLEELVSAWAVYQRNKLALAGAFVLCVVVAGLLITSFHCVALGLPFDAPSFAHHLIIVPIELTAGAIPITPGGVGAREATVEWLYRGFGITGGQGGIIAFAHGLTMLTVGGLATIYYLSRRASVRANMASAQAPDAKPSDENA